jgi:hypothetical protein
MFISRVNYECTVKYVVYVAATACSADCAPSMHVHCTPGGLFMDAVGGGFWQ